MTKTRKILIFGIAILVTCVSVYFFATDYINFNFEVAEGPNISEIQARREKARMEEDTRILASNPAGYVVGLGQYKEAPIKDGIKSYQSDELKISFSYPSKFLLFENKTEDEAGEIVGYFIILMPDIPFIRDAIRGVRGYGRGEWPPSISFSFYREPGGVDLLEEWLQENQLRSNFISSIPEQEIAVNKIFVAGIPALSYFIEDGLYPFDTVAFIYNEWVVLAHASFGSIGEHMRDDFESILSTFVIEKKKMRMDTINSTIAGDYVTILPDVLGLGQATITLGLSPMSPMVTGARASMTINYVDSSLSFWKIGGWEILENGRVRVTLSDSRENGRYDKPEVIDFRFQEGVLIATKYNKNIYGKRELEFKKKREASLVN